MGKMQKCGLYCLIVTLKVNTSSHYAWKSANKAHSGLLINKINNASYLKMC